jgi:hypothetical protein
MSEKIFPYCPICNREVLLPFSSDHVSAGGKAFSCWFCSNCGFYLTTVDNKAVNPKKDIKAGFNIELRQKILEMKDQYKKTKS